MNKKIINDEVAILYSPGFGAGWSTWNADADCLFDPETVDWVLNGKLYPTPNWGEKFGEFFYAGGAYDLEVAWLTVGTMFRINEYDGSESIEISADIDWMIA